MKASNTDYADMFDYAEIVHGHPSTFEQLSDVDVTLIDKLTRGFETEAVTIHGADPLHVAYFDKSSRDVNNSVLMYLQQEDMTLLHAGVRVSPGSDEKRGWIEVKPREFYEENFW